MSANYNGGNWIRRERRLAIHLRDAFTCLCCGRDLRGSTPGQLTLDHLITKGRGGSNDSANLVTCCLSCNSRRGDKIWTKFYPAGAHQRVRNAVRRALNLDLAKELIAGSQLDTP